MDLLALAGGSGIWTSRDGQFEQRHSAHDQPEWRGAFGRERRIRAQKDTRFAQVLDALLTAPTTPQGTLEPISAGPA